MAIRLDNQFATNLKELYIMGGNTEGLLPSNYQIMDYYYYIIILLYIIGVGNITVSAEFNFHSDPEAAFIVLQNIQCPTFIACWELCFHKTKIEFVLLFLPFIYKAL